MSVDPHLSIGATLGTQWLDWDFSLYDLSHLWNKEVWGREGGGLCFFEFPEMRFLVESGSPLLPAAWCGASGASEWKMIPSISLGLRDVVAVAPQMEVVAQTRKSCCNSRCGWQMAGGAGGRWRTLKASSPAGYWHPHAADIHPFSYRGTAMVLIPISWVNLPKLVLNNSTF